MTDTLGQAQISPNFKRNLSFWSAIRNLPLATGDARNFLHAPTRYAISHRIVLRDTSANVQPT